MMFVVQINDRNAFAQKAKTLRKPVTVVRTATVVPVQRSGAIVMHPAVALDYSLEFRDPSMGETRWTFREVALTDDQGRVDLGESLMALLESVAPQRLDLNSHPKSMC